MTACRTSSAPSGAQALRHSAWEERGLAACVCHGKPGPRAAATPGYSDGLRRIRSKRDGDIIAPV